MQETWDSNFLPYIGSFDPGATLSIPFTFGVPFDLYVSDDMHALSPEDYSVSTAGVDVLSEWLMTFDTVLDGQGRVAHGATIHDVTGAPELSTWLLSAFAIASLLARGRMAEKIRARGAK